SLPRPNAIKEVLHVIGRRIKLHFAEFARQVFALLPRRIRRVESAAIDPNPAFAADPFHAALDVGMAARKGHGHALRIFQFEAEFRSAVPRSIMRWKFAAA